MPKLTHPPDAAAEFRRQAEARWQERQSDSTPPRTDADARRLLHELEVHQIELEMQNADLERARDELEAALERITDLYDFAPVGYLTLDPEGVVREANLAAAGLLGIARSALAKRQFGLFVVPADRPAFAAFLQQVFASKSRERCEVSLGVDGKSPFPAELEAVATDSGRECRVVLTDLTERKRAAEDRLILSKLESTGVLAGGIAHDFNNLLTGIVLNLELAQMLAPADGDLARHLEDAKKTAFLARSLTKQLVTFSKGGAPFRKATALSGVILESVRPALSGSRVQCDFSLPGDLWPVLVDEGQIGQVLCNLVLNAREAMPDGGVISIRAENVARRTQKMPALPAGGYVRVRIVDQGVGISPEDLPRIFDPYFSTKQRGTQKGMGLGLTICHAIIKKHGGAIAVKSEPGAGTTFDVYLPVAAQPAGEGNAAGPRDPPPHRKILAMVDQDTVREVFGKALRKMGHEVELVEDGHRAVEAYGSAKGQGRPFDAVILDLTVRDGVGGQETIQKLLKIEPAVKAIVMSGYANDPVILEAERYGFKGVLAKPFAKLKLREILSRVLGPGSSDG